MSEWNLSVRLTGQGSGLARTLRSTSRDARAASRDVNALRRDIGRLRAEAARDIRIRVRADARSLRSDVRAALSSAGSGQRLGIRLGVDAGRLRSDVQTALTAAGAGQGIRIRLDVDAAHLRDDVQAALTAAGAGQNLTVDLNVDGAASLAALREEAGQTAHSLNTLQRATREAKNELEELEARALTTAAAVRIMNTAASRGRNRLDTLSASTRTFRTDLDDLDGSLTRVGSRLGDLRGRVGGLGGGGGGGGALGGADGLKGLLLLAPAAIPLVAGLSTSLAPLPGLLGAAGVSAAAFGIALGGQVERLGEVADAEKKYQEAVAEHGRSSAEAVKAQLQYQQMLAQLPPEAQRAAVALSQMKQNFRDWSDDMASFTMTPLTNGITVLDQLIPRLTPHVESFSTQLDRVVTVAGGAIQTPGFDAMADKFADFSDRQLDEMTDGVMHFLRVLSEGGAFQSGPIAEFMAYAQQNGPAAREALSAISDAVVTLLQAGAEAGPTMLNLITAAAQLVAALPPELVGIIIQVAAGLKLIQLAGAGAAAIAGGIAALGGRIAALQAASTAAGGGMAGLAAAFGTLGTAAKAMLIASGIGILLVALSQLSDMGKQAPPDVDKLTTSLRSLGTTGKVTGEAARSFGKDLSGLADSLQKVTDPKGLDQVQQSIVSFFGADSTPVKEAKENIDAVDKALANLVKNGQADLAAAALDKLSAKLKSQGFSADEIRSQMDDYKSALADAKFEQELAAQSMGLFGQAAQQTSAKLEAQKQSADGLRQAITALNDVNRAAGSAMSAFEQSIDDTTEALKDHAGALKMRDGELDLGSEKAREAEKALSDLAANTDAAATAAREQNKSWEHVTGIYSRGRKAFIDAADAMGLTKAQAEALADSYLSIPDKKTMSVEMRTEDAVAGLDAVIAEIEKTPDSKSVTVKALTADAQSMLRGLGFEVTQLKDGSFKVTASTATAEVSLASVQGLRDKLADKSITISAHTQDTINSLSNVQAKVASTKGKTITMAAPTAAARHQLELLGFKIRDTKGKNVVITAPTGGPRAGVTALAAAIANLRNKSVTITTNYVVTESGARRSGSHGTQLRNARGGVWDYYADGGIRGGRSGRVSFYAAGGMEPGDRPNQHVAQIAPAGSYRVWGEAETEGEGYVPFRRSARPRSRAITEEIVRRLGGEPGSIQWNAAGSVTDWRYDPQTGSLYSGSDITSAGNKTRKVKTKVKGKWQTKEVEYFDIGAVEKKLKSAAKATQAWNADLQKVADRVGGDVAEALASMGKEGMKLADKMANGSTKYINDMAAALRNLQKTAKASLTDYTRQLGTANKMNKDFADDLTKLAAMGYGDLAAQLAEQNDLAAQQLADAAVKDKGKAAKANAQAKTANNALTSDQVQSLVQIIAAISSNKVGIHDVAAKTGLGEDEIIDIATKAKGQISSSLGSRAARFLSDLGKAQKHMAYADGGIRAGLYASRGGIIRFAEPETHGEAYVPLSPSKRRSALPVLHDVATRFGLGLTDARSTRPVVIVRESSPTNVTVTAVRTGATASDIASQVGRSVRRARRGGVAARAA
ncbi:hypothetical protein [Streptomyces violaceus]|uniref:Phage tail protein n=1 Tax=Streptomyces violaceus TaxID=1936 RepID=A0ABY9UMS5_STRVL|nr:hypothetical protein [Streptomyces janthinus]WND24118.1 hypothetical protein RI060_43135 [Streptomyces janthinus]GGS97071.1 hypothetical protein GCM10010270_81390 [Streptomyces janthinus]